jgi:hypothetical protein
VRRGPAHAPKLARRREVVVTSTEVYRASHIKRHRATKAEVELRREKLFEIVEAMKPMTVRQVFYQATVRDIVEKSEAGYTKVQTDLVVMRRADDLPYEWLADNTRWQRKPRTFHSVEQARAWRVPVSASSAFSPSVKLRYGPDHDRR